MQESLFSLKNGLRNSFVTFVLPKNLLCVLIWVYLSKAILMSFHTILLMQNVTNMSSEFMCLVLHSFVISTNPCGMNW